MKRMSCYEKTGAASVPLHFDRYHDYIGSFPLLQGFEGTFSHFVKAFAHNGT